MWEKKTSASDPPIHTHQARPTSRHHHHEPLNPYCVLKPFTQHRRPSGHRASQPYCSMRQTRTARSVEALKSRWPTVSREVTEPLCPCSTSCHPHGEQTRTRHQRRSREERWNRCPLSSGLYCKIKAIAHMDSGMGRKMRSCGWQVSSEPPSSWHWSSPSQTFTTPSWRPAGNRWKKKGSFHSCSFHI